MNGAHFQPTTATRFFTLGALLFGAGLLVLLAFHQRLIVHVILTIFWAVYAASALFFRKYFQRQIERHTHDADMRKKLEWRILLVMWLWTIMGTGGAVAYAYLTFCDLSKS